jgi:helix-hairpin-helix protein
MAPVDINLAAPQHIMLLRGIGRVNAARIIAGRPFNTNYDLVTRNIISENSYDKIAADLTEQPGHARAVRPDLLESVTHPEYNRKRQPRAVVVDALEPGTEELIDLG